MDRLKDFMLFLCEENCVEDFFKSFDRGVLGYNTAEYFSKVLPAHWIFDAFSWMESSSGDAYWFYRHKRWNKRLNNKD